MAFCKAKLFLSFFDYASNTWIKYSFEWISTSDSWIKRVKAELYAVIGIKSVHNKPYYKITFHCKKKTEKHKTYYYFFLIFATMLTWMSEGLAGTLCNGTTIPVEVDICDNVLRAYNLALEKMQGSLLTFPLFSHLPVLKKKVHRTE